jgi:hypothetical protein
MLTNFNVQMCGRKIILHFFLKNHRTSRSLLSRVIIILAQRKNRAHEPGTFQTNQKPLLCPLLPSRSPLPTKNPTPFLAGGKLRRAAAEGNDPGDYPARGVLLCQPIS